MPKEAPWLDEFVHELLSFPGRQTIRSMRCRRVWPGAVRRGRRPWFSEPHVDWEDEQIPKHSIQNEICKPMNQLVYFFAGLTPARKLPVRTANIKNSDPVQLPARCISHTRPSPGI